MRCLVALLLAVARVRVGAVRCGVPRVGARRPALSVAGFVAVDGEARTLRDEAPALWRMARPTTLPLGAGLVAAGAVGAAGLAPPEPALARASRLCLGVALTALVTGGSMLINDYHDHARGVDTAETKPGRPLVTGEVRPRSVKLVLKWLYCAHLCLLCLVDSAAMRLWVLLNTLLTYVYSVHLKPVPFVKNAACATVVAMAVGLGGLAVGGGVDGVIALARPMVAVGGLVAHREMCMDVKDAAGDGAAGVSTVPVRYGRREAMRVAYAPLSIAALAAATAPRRALAATAPLLAQGALARRVLAALERNSGDSPRALRDAIELAPLWLALTLVALVA